MGGFCRAYYNTNRAYADEKKEEFEEIACGDTIWIVSPGAFFRGKKICNPSYG